MCRGSAEGSGEPQCAKRPKNLHLWSFFERHYHARRSCQPHGPLRVKKGTSRPHNLPLISFPTLFMRARGGVPGAISRSSQRTAYPVSGARTQYAPAACLGPLLGALPPLIVPTAFCARHCCWYADFFAACCTCLPMRSLPLPLHACAYSPEWPPRAPLARARCRRCPTRGAFARACVRRCCAWVPCCRFCA